MWWHETHFWGQTEDMFSKNALLFSTATGSSTKSIVLQKETKLLIIPINWCLGPHLKKKLTVTVCYCSQPLHIEIQSLSQVTFCRCECTAVDGKKLIRTDTSFVKTLHFNLSSLNFQLIGNQYFCECNFTVIFYHLQRVIKQFSHVCEKTMIIADFFVNLASSIQKKDFPDSCQYKEICDHKLVAIVLFSNMELCLPAK